MPTLARPRVASGFASGDAAVLIPPGAMALILI